MRKAQIYFNAINAGVFEEIEKNRQYQFSYRKDYNGEPVSLTMPTKESYYEFNTFPPFFEGLLPEGFQLEALLRSLKIDRDDCFSQLMAVGQDLVGAVTLREMQ